MISVILSGACWRTCAGACSGRQTEAILRTYRGQRSEFGCEVTVDGRPLRLRSDLTGASTTTFEWGQNGNRQLALALLSDLLGDDEKAKRLCGVFEREVVGRLPHESWTMSDSALVAALGSVDGRQLHPSDNGNGARIAAPQARAPKKVMEDPKRSGRPDKPLETLTVAAAAAAKQVNHETIARLAYDIWERNGRIDGRALGDWLEAEARLRAQR